MRLAAVCLYCLGLLVACGGDKAAGSEGGPCYGNGACDHGLSCYSELCVRVPDGQDVGPPADGGSTADQGKPADQGSPPDKGKPADQGAPPDKGKLADITLPKTGWPARVFAPYVDSTLYPVLKLADGPAAATGLKHYKLGFIVAKTSTSCLASWGTYYDIATGPESWSSGTKYLLYDQIKKVRSTFKGDVVVSFGGASNTPLAAACATSSALAAQYQSVISKLSLTRIDFDIEGPWQSGASVSRRSKTIAALQQSMAASGKPLEVWLTLPVLPSGLTANGLAVVDDALTHGVKLHGVNVMTMDFGSGAAPKPQGKMGAYCIQAATSLHGQLKILYKKHGAPRTDAQLWAMTGMTPMIGMNDVKTEVFTLADAKQVLTFGQNKQLGLLSFWSLNRDNPCPTSTTVQLKCSSSPDQKQAYEFTNIFKVYTSP